MEALIICLIVIGLPIGIILITFSQDSQAQNNE